MSAETIPCPGCEGRGVQEVRVQRQVRGQGRRCAMETWPCWVCHGRLVITAAEWQAFTKDWQEHQGE